jgi:phosphate/sulfate permease
MHQVEHEADRIMAEVYEALNRTFVTPLDRSDIYALAVSLEIAMSLTIYSGGSHAAAHFHVPLWVMVACALAMCAGTMVGGVRIIKTMGTKIFDLKPVHGFAAETSAAVTILGA